MSIDLPFHKSWLEEEEHREVEDTLNSGWLTTGPKTQKFEEAFKDYIGCRHAVALNSCTAGLHLALTVQKFAEGDEVITTPITFCATSNAALYQGADVKFVDIDENTLNIDSNLIEAKITKHTKAIMPVDFRGHPANLPEIRQIADRHNLKIIEDGSHSIGSSYTYNGKRFVCGDGVHANLCTYSFHPVKHITTGEGGAVLTNDPNLYQKLFLLRKHGIDRREDMFNEKLRIGSWIYDMELLGYNYRLTDFQAALGMNQLKKIDIIKTRRREIVNYYNEHFSNIDELILPYENKIVNSNFHIYTLQVKENPRFDRYDLFTYLENKNYAPMVHYIPVHLLSYYKQHYGHKRGDFPIAENYYDRTISIPLYPSLTNDEVEKVVKNITSFVESKYKNT